MTAASEGASRADGELTAPLASATQMAAPQGASHRWVDHTGELSLQVRAPTLELLFEQAGRALAELQLEGAMTRTLGDDVRVEVEARDPAALLAAWLNELIFLSEINKRVFTDLHVERVTDKELSAHVRGVVPSALRTPVKAATMHDLSVEATPAGYAARIVLDV